MKSVKRDYKFLKNTLFSLFCITFSLFFVSCEAEATLEKASDNSVTLSFSGKCGQYFENMIRTFSASDDQDSIFDADSIRNELEKSGFKNVSVSLPDNSCLIIKITDSGSSYLFSSGLLSFNNGKLVLSVTPSVLKNFYNASDNQTKAIFDLFISPVFNDEEMTEDEYLELVGAFYGYEASEEIKNCVFKLTLVSNTGSKIIQKIPLVELLTLTEKKSFSVTLN